MSNAALDERVLMTGFRNLPIKRKLILITMLISCITVLLGCATFAVYEQSVFRRTMARDFAIMADMFDDNVASGLAFKDKAAIEQTLKTLSVQVHIIAAGVYDKSGELFAGYTREDVGSAFHFPELQSTHQHFSKDRLETVQTITLAGEAIGVVYIASDLRELDERAWRYVFTVIALLLLCSLAAMPLASFLQKIISQPIIGLAETAAAVAEGKDYSLRAVKRSGDEVGRLIDTFNDMLGQIQTRDDELRKAGSELEKRVAERTSELAGERARFKFIFESLPVGIAWMISKRLETRIVNNEHARISGVPREKCRELDLYRQQTMAEDQVLQDELHRQLQAGEIDHYAIEKRYIHPNGRICWAELSIRFFRDPVTGEGQEISSLVDITERKRTQEESENMHRRLLETSRQAGMAEVATSVLHNVGNVLNSVNITATLLSDEVKKSKAPMLSKLVAMLHQHRDDLGEFLDADPRGKQVIPYLSSLADELAREQSAQLTEIVQLRKNIDHIKDVVAMQQGYAQISGFREIVNVIDLVEDSLRMNIGSFGHHGIEIRREFAEVPPINIDKHKILQILVNLLRNAKHACQDPQILNKYVVVRVDQFNGFIRIAVIDSGVGIPPENLVRIFSHGFTTKKEGHGFGLHSAALAAKEMGGTLTVTSEGPQKGATFTLELPLG